MADATCTAPRLRLAWKVRKSPSPRSASGVISRGPRVAAAVRVDRDELGARRLCERQDDGRAPGKEPISTIRPPEGARARWPRRAAAPARRSSSPRPRRRPRAPRRSPRAQGSCAPCRSPWRRPSAEGLGRPTPDCLPACVMGTASREPTVAMRTACHGRRTGDERGGQQRQRVAAVPADVLLGARDQPEPHRAGEQQPGCRQGPPRRAPFAHEQQRDEPGASPARGWPGHRPRAVAPLERALGHVVDERPGRVEPVVVLRLRGDVRVGLAGPIK